MNTKVCTKCHKKLLLTEDNFQRRKDSKDGYRSECRECRSKYLKEYREKNHETILEYNRTYNIVNKDKRTSYKALNKDKIYLRERTYKINNIEKTRIHLIKSKHKCKAIKEKLHFDFSYEQWEECKTYFNNKCAYCGKEKKLEQEHFIPTTEGGNYTVDNIIPACKSCNSSKNNRPFEQWYKEYKYYSKEREKKIYEYLNTR